MGGYGSGRPSRKQKADECRSLDVNRLNREGLLNIGQNGSWIWSRHGSEVARISYHMTSDTLVLDYKIRAHGEDWVAVSEAVPIEHVQCHFGGQRPYFRCPGIIGGGRCQRRVGKLFLGGRHFLCRHCYDLAYESQSELPQDRMLRRANKLRVALGGEPGAAHWIAPKPKGMWQRTYQRKRLEIEWCESQANQLFIAKFAPHLSEEEREMYFGKFD